MQASSKPCRAYMPAYQSAPIPASLQASQVCNATSWLPVHLAKPTHLQLLLTPGHLLQAAELLAQATSGRRTLRERRPQMPCPSCKLDIAEFMATAQINL